MPGLLVSRPFLLRCGDALARVEAETRLELQRIVLPEDPAGRLSPDEIERIEIAYFSGDLFPEGARAFFASTLGAPRLEWVHVFNAGVDHSVFQRLIERGVRLTTSSGAAAAPIAQTALAAILAISRGFPHWLEAQRRRAWESLPTERIPRDLSDQTLLVVGLGAIGREIARLAGAVGFRVIGVRRGPKRPDDPVDEVHPPTAFSALLPQVDWLVLACPLTAQTRGLVDAAALARLPRGAGIANVARGEVIEEKALIDALSSGQLGAAYLDVFETEPLPATSPLWTLPNVWVTPHNSAASKGNLRRQNELFLANLGRYGRGEPLESEVPSS